MISPRVTGIGELLWDLLPAGPQMGGAPANFACHAASFGAEASVISAVGDDPLGRQLLEGLIDIGLRVDGVAIHPHLPTGTVGVELDDHGQPAYTIHAGSAWDTLVAGPSQLALAARADAICFGTLAQRMPESAAAVRKLLDTAPAGALRVLDINLRTPFYTAELIADSLAQVSVLKLNEDELRELSTLFGLSFDPLQACAELRSRFDLHLIACTRGSRGCVLDDGHEWVEAPGIPIQPLDTVGAGDSFTAALVMGLLHRWPLEAIARIANETAAQVCTAPGGIQPLPEALRRRFYDADRSANQPALLT